jgi:predicted metal-dependent peptidase
MLATGNKEVTMDKLASKKLTKARIALQTGQPFFGYLVTSLEPVEKEDLNPPSMATDGSHLFYHPDFVNDIPFKELVAVCAHEVGHIILWHLPRRHGRQHQRWNIAADYAVNDLLSKEGFILPNGCLINPKYADKSVETIYNELPVKEVEVAVTVDSHGPWSDWGNGNNQSDTGAKTTSDNLQQEWKQRIAGAVNQARMQGSVSSRITSLVEEILQPKLDWKTILPDMITSCAKSNYCLTKPNKKMLWQGIYLPGITGTEIRIAAVIDSSGSISTQDARIVIGHIHGICESYDDYTIWLYTCDTRIQQRWELHPGDPLPKIIQGRGGTSFKEPIEEAAKLPITCLVYFTDMYGTFPKEPYYPVIWLATTDVKAPWGFTIRYKGGAK